MPKPTRAAVNGAVTITPTPAEFWELQARLRAVDAARGAALKAEIEHRRRIQEAHQRAQTQLDAFAIKYGLPREGELEWDDTALTVTCRPTPTKG